MIILVVQHSYDYGLPCWVVAKRLRELQYSSP